MRPRFCPGIATLFDTHPGLLSNHRIALVTHPAALDVDGRTSDDLLATASGNFTLAALFAPEHGFFSAAGAGELVADMVHPLWNIPIHSLYGTTRRPTDEMLKDIDLILFDLQDLSIRPYTYGSTLRYVMEAASAHKIPLIVADRPDPLARIVDGPTLRPALESFVGAIPAPFAYGMTIGETANYLKDKLGLSLELHVARMQGYARELYRATDWQPWISPSPSIRTWETAMLYPVTVLLEALPCLDHGRSTSTPFQLIGAPWLDAHALARCLNEIPLTGLRAHPCAYRPVSGRYAQQTLQGIRLTLSHPLLYKPVTAFVQILTCIQKLHGSEKLWGDTETRPDFFDQLAGVRQLREQLMAQVDADAIIATWQPQIALFEAMRSRHLLYSENTPT